MFARNAFFSHRLLEEGLGEPLVSICFLGLQDFPWGYMVLSLTHSKVSRILR